MHYSNCCYCNYMLNLWSLLAISLQSDRLYIDFKKLSDEYLWITKREFSTTDFPFKMDPLYHVFS